MLYSFSWFERSTRKLCLLVSLGCPDIVLNSENWIPKNQLPPHIVCTYAHTHDVPRTHTHTHTHTHHTHTTHTQPHTHTHTHITTHTHTTNTHHTHTDTQTHHTHTQTHTAHTTPTPTQTHHTHHTHWISENERLLSLKLLQFVPIWFYDSLIPTPIPRLPIIKLEAMLLGIFCLSNSSFLRPCHLDIDTYKIFPTFFATPHTQRHSTRTFMPTHSHIHTNTHIQRDRQLGKPFVILLEAFAPCLLPGDY